MATLAELLRLDTSLTTRQLLQFQRLISWWALLADLSFADLLLFAPTSGSDSKYVVASQIRPTTSQTLYQDDFVGHVSDEVERPLVARCFRLGQIVEGEISLSPPEGRARVICVPVRYEEAVIGVLTRETVPNFKRNPGELERTYVEVFRRFAAMMAAGSFPYSADIIDPEDLPRVGDGVVMLDSDAQLLYASPNAVSTLHRIGVHGQTKGQSLTEMGLKQDLVKGAIRSGVPATGEVDRGDDVVVQLVALPLMGRSGVDAAVVLMRDISELRRRDRLLLSKDATIREIHHRVKNNLQTISALLRLQSRRTNNPGAKEAIEESVRRIRSISMVHEILAHESGEDVPLLEVVEHLVRMVEDGLISDDRKIRFRVGGRPGHVDAAVVTPLSVILNELLQNVVDHAFPGPTSGGAADGYVGEVSIEVETSPSAVTMTVTDNGVGLPAGFAIERDAGLGTSIVHTLATTELNGTIELRRRDGEESGTQVVVVVPHEAAS